MSGGVKFSGLDELRARLRNLPAELADGAKDIVVDHAKDAYEDIYAAYPSRTGNLREHLRLTIEDGGRYGVLVRLRNTAKHAHIFEFGTVARHSSIRSTGIMPAGRVFVPRAIRHRHAMYAEIIAYLKTFGFEVSGHG